jgi:putative SOS response-associated peptidase YedK
MCGRYQLSLPFEELETLFAAVSAVSFEPRYNIAPSQEAPVIRSSRGARGIQGLKWGLVPDWAPLQGASKPMINARSETVSEKPTFRDSFRYRRCLVPATGFYEWQRADGAKQPYVIRIQDVPVYAMAGIWSQWRGPEGINETFSILTTMAAPKIQPIHERMPVILHPDTYGLWMNPQSGRDQLLSLCRPVPDEVLTIEMVSDRVNSARHDDPECEAPPAHQHRLL